MEQGTLHSAEMRLLHRPHLMSLLFVAQPRTGRGAPLSVESKSGSPSRFQVPPDTLNLKLQHWYFIL